MSQLLSSVFDPSDVDRGEGIESCRADGDDPKKSIWGLALFFREVYPNVVSCLVKPSVLLTTTILRFANFKSRKQP